MPLMSCSLAKLTDYAWYHTRVAKNMLFIVSIRLGCKSGQAMP